MKYKKEMNLFQENRMKKRNGWAKQIQGEGVVIHSLHFP